MEIENLREVERQSRRVIRLLENETTKRGDDEISFEDGLSSEFVRFVKDIGIGPFDEVPLSAQATLIFTWCTMVSLPARLWESLRCSLMADEVAEISAEITQDVD